MRRVTLSLLALAAIPVANAATMRQVFSVPISYDGTASSVDIQRFNPAMGTLNSVTAYAFVRTTGSAKVENLDTNGGVGAFQFNLGATVSTTTLLGDFTLTQGIATSKWTEAVLGAYDGTTDYAGNSGFSRNYSASARIEPVTSTDPVALGFITGVTPVTINVTGVKNMDWMWYRAWLGNGEPSLDLSATGNATVVITYDYTPTAP